MSSFFSANQYEGAFKPERLLNYQVPAQHKEHPSTRTGRTKIISNDFGHITIESKRSPSSQWSSFVGTWQAERKPIQLKTKTKLQKFLYADKDVDKEVGKVCSNGKEVPTDDTQVLSESPTEMTKVKRSSNGSRAGTAEEYLVQSPPHGHESKTEFRPESIQPKSQNEVYDSEIVSRSSSRPESRMAEAETQSPLGSRPQSELLTTKST